MPIENREVNEEKVNEEKVNENEVKPNNVDIGGIKDQLALLKEGIPHSDFTDAKKINQEIISDGEDINRLVNDSRDDRYA